MKHLSILLFTVVTLSCSADTPDPEVSYKFFFDLKESEAESKAAALAKRDFEAGIYRVPVFGLRPAPDQDPYAKHLNLYGVLCDPIAGCIVSDGIIGATKGYNKIMKQLLLKKFGKDIFAEYGQEKNKKGA